jgi:hypothetical protein
MRWIGVGEEDFGGQAPWAGSFSVYLRFLVGVLSVPIPPNESCLEAPEYPAIWPFPTAHLGVELTHIKIPDREVSKDREDTW